MDHGYDIVPATKEDHDKIAEFLRQNFYPHEPLNVGAKAPPNRPNNSIFSLQFLEEGISLLAVSRNERRILGVCINGKECPNNESPTRSRPPFTNEAYSKIGDFLNKIENSVDIFKITGCDRAIYIHVLAVDPVVQGRGIGKALMECTRDMAISAGYLLMYIMCTSYFSSKIARSLGMQQVYSLPYSEYQNEDGTPVFSPPEPHTKVTIFIQKLGKEA